MLNDKEEQKYKELRLACKKLKVIPPVEIMIGLKVRDKNNELIFDDIQRGHSWIRNFYNTMFCRMAGAGTTTNAVHGPGYLNVQYTNSDLITTSIPSSIYTLATATQYNSGIEVGRDNTAFNINSGRMLGRISHGSGTNQLIFGACSTLSRTYEASTDVWTTVHKRVMNNNSGSTIEIKEVGYSSTTYLMERSVLDPIIELVDAGKLTVTYSISMDFSAIDS